MRLAHFGTFDILNYGDLLFPLIAEHNLGQDFDEVVHISPVGGKPYGDVPGSISFRDALRSDLKFDAVLVGGGNIVHARPSNLAEYRNVRRVAYADLWAGAAQLAARQAIPIAFNAPGVPRPVRNPTKIMTSAVLRQVNYPSVRDVFSRDYLGNTSGVTSVIPDSALGISEVLGPLEHLKESIPAELAELVKERYFIVHINDRYTELDLPALAKSLDAISSNLDARACLVAIGPCHGDDVFARAVGELMGSRPAIFDRPRSVRAIAALIAGAHCYVGSSLHGFITATSYRVPAVLVASHRAQHKFQGLLSQLPGGEARMLDDWTAVVERTSGSGSESAMFGSSPDLTAVHATLEDHWNAVRQALHSDAIAPSPVVRHGSAPGLTAAMNFAEYGLRQAIIRRVNRLHRKKAH